MRKTRIGIVLLLISIGLPGVRADTVRVAAAANFTAAMKQIAAAFEAATGHGTIISYGSTGKLYAQIENGAPFDLFLAADQARPEKLFAEGRAAQPFTYAIGKLVLWSADANRLREGVEVLRGGDFARLAIANPKTAPYGAAAIQVLEALGLADALTPRLVRGDNIAQTYQFVATGNAEVGFVARAQIALDDRGSHWDVPQVLYSPIRQDAVLLDRGRNNPAARALIEYLRSQAARQVIARYGYGVE